MPPLIEDAQIPIDEKLISKTTMARKSVRKIKYLCSQINASTCSHLNTRRYRLIPQRDEKARTQIVDFTEIQPFNKSGVK